MTAEPNSMAAEGRVKFAIEVACGSTVSRAASLAGVSERTGHRWMNDPTMQADIERNRAELIEAAIGAWAASQSAITAAGLQALSELVDIVQNPKASFASR